MATIKMKSIKQRVAERKAHKQRKPKKRGPKIKKTKHDRITHDENGVPLADPPRNKSLLGNSLIPDTEGKAYLEKEKNQAQVEILMLKGVVTAHHIAVTLGISFNTAKKYIEQVQYRWAVLGSSTRMRQLKGEAKARLELINNETWVLFSNSKDEKIKATCLSQLMGVHDRRLILDGLTPQVMPLLIAQEGKEGMTSTVEEQIKNHSNMVRLASALMDYTRKQPEPIEDADFTEIVEK